VVALDARIPAGPVAVRDSGREADKFRRSGMCLSWQGPVAGQLHRRLGPVSQRTDTRSRAHTDPRTTGYRACQRTVPLIRYLKSIVSDGGLSSLSQ